MRTQTEILQELYTINQYVLKGIPDSDIPTDADHAKRSGDLSGLYRQASMVAESGKLAQPGKGEGLSRAEDIQ
jgi:hypothetical protein